MHECKGVHECAEIGSRVGVRAYARVGVRACARVRECVGMYLCVALRVGVLMYVLTWFGRLCDGYQQRSTLCSPKGKWCPLP